jgi:hypothetical protein
VSCWTLCCVHPLAFDMGVVLLTTDAILRDMNVHMDTSAPTHGAALHLQICVAKAGLTATMPARATVIAAANPKGGRYSRARTLQENVKMSPALLSRFDLIFTMLDEADEARDHKLSEHVMGVHCAGACLQACLKYVHNAMHPLAQLCSDAPGHAPSLPKPMENP